MNVLLVLSKRPNHLPRHLAGKFFVDEPSKFSFVTSRLSVFT